MYQRRKQVIGFMDAAEVQEALRSVGQLVRGDGGDITVRKIDAETGAIELELILEDAHCRECVMPRAFLETLFLERLRELVPGTNSILVHDPREPI